MFIIEVQNNRIHKKNEIVGISDHYWGKIMKGKGK